MTYFDVFNGDADGIFALIQLRKHQPVASQKITGVKRDIALVSRCDAKQGDKVTVLDVSLEKNHTAVATLLNQGVNVFYADHHRAGDILDSSLLELHINLDANICTSLIIDDYLNGEYRAWAIAGAFGDNLIKQADALCIDAGYSQVQRDFLCELGTLVNYNGYGSKLEDLHIAPNVLFEQLFAYASPFDLLDDANSPYFLLKDAYHQDMTLAQNITEFYSDLALSVVILPNESFSRRISGVLGNQLANNAPDKAHLVLSLNQDQSYTVSLRAPLNNKQGADVICSAFATGGGRAGAAGINQLPKDAINELINATASFYSMEK